jgi:Tfp pilus assembly protein PilN
LVPVYYGYILKARLIEKEQHLSQLIITINSKDVSDSQPMYLDRMIKSINDKEYRINELKVDGDRWSNSLILINRAIPSHCFLEEIKEEKTGVCLVGVVQSYYDLARFVEAIQKQPLFSQVNVVNSKLDKNKAQISFELFGLWPVIDDEM